MSIARWRCSLPGVGAGRRGRRGRARGWTGAPDRIALAPESDGYFGGRAADAAVGTLYRYRLDGRTDAAARSGVAVPARGPARAVLRDRPRPFEWTDDAWRGRPLVEQVLYELHVGTFTPEGTWAAAIARAARPGRARGDDARGHAGGRVPRRLRLGLRRRGPVRADPPLRRARRLPALRRPARIAPGSASSSTSSTTTAGRTAVTCASSPRRGSPIATDNEWGDALNFDGADAGPVREFFIANAGYWIDEFHLDGLRLDATQSIHDASRRARPGRDGSPRAAGAPGRAHDRAGRGERAAGRPPAAADRPGRLRSRRRVERRLPSQRAGRAHRSPRGLLHRLRRHARRSSSRPPSGATSIRASATPGSGSAGARRPCGIESSRFVAYLQNHDQVANSASGLRLHALTSPGRAARHDRAAAARPVDAAAVSGPGVRVVRAVPLLRRSRRRAGAGRAPGPRGVPGAVPEHRGRSASTGCRIPAIVRPSSDASSTRGSARCTPTRWRSIAIC